MRRVLVTGPVERIAEYADAARAAGWEAIELALLRIEPRPFDRSDLRGERYEWICVTSASALPYLESAVAATPSLRAVPCAVVGERTACRVRDAGLRVEIVQGEGAEALAEALLRQTGPGSRVLWPRGSLSDGLARALRQAGLDVEDPVAYATLPVEAPSPTPPARAVFFASPSAVRAWVALPRGESHPVAIAIGRTTLDALHEETVGGFFDTISLPEPSPEAFGAVLSHLDPETRT